MKDRDEDVSMEVTQAFIKIANMKGVIKMVQGGQGAGKTYSILMRWILLALRSKETQHCRIAAATYPELTAGTFKDFVTICETLKIEYTVIKKPMSITINKWFFEFISVDKASKGRGPRRDRLFINEANTIGFEAVRQLIDRTHYEVFLDFNPVNKFWGHCRYVDTGIGSFIKLTYKDNHLLPRAEIDRIEDSAPWGKAPDENHWRVYGLGEMGYVEGQVYKFKTYDELPEGGFMKVIGIDYGGGGGDPMAVVALWIDEKNKVLYARELLYDIETTIENVGDIIKADPDYDKGDLIVCEHNPPQYRKTLRDKPYFLNAIKAKKNRIHKDIMVVKTYKMFLHKDSKNLINEAENYKFKTINYSGELLITNVPDPRTPDHLMDALKYALITTAEKKYNDYTAW